MLDRVEAEARLRLSEGLHNFGHAFVEVMGWMPEALRVELVLQGKIIPWEAVELAPTLEVARHLDLRPILDA